MNDATVRLRIAGEDEIVLPLGDGPVTIEDGFGGWTVIARPDQRPITEWDGQPAERMAVPILFDGFDENRSVQADLDQLLALGRGTREEPPPHFRLLGPIPLSGREWVVEGFSPVGSLRNERMVLVRYALTMTLLAHGETDLIRPRKRRRVYEVKKGDTLVSIAKKLYNRNELKRAREIGKLNDIRDIRRRLNPGRKLRLP